MIEHMETQINSIYDLQIKDFAVTKHRKGEKSTYNKDLFKEYYFVAKFEFTTGSIVEFQMVEPRIEYKDIESLSVTPDDLQKARKIAYEEYQRTLEMIKSEKFAYSRDKGHYCNIYHRDDTSPTGVRNAGGCSSYKLADHIAHILGKSTSLSSTENLQTSH